MPGWFPKGKGVCFRLNFTHPGIFFSGMIKPSIIPTNFDIPAGMDHRWVFVAGPFRSEIKAHSARKISIRDHRVPNKHIPNTGQGFTKEQLEDGEGTMAMVRSRNLDWIQESIEHLRYLCEADE